MDSLIIRAEVIEARRSRRAGAIVLARPVSMKVAASCSAALVIAISLLLGFGEYTSKVRVAGQLVPVGGAIKVVAAQFGRISARHVMEGDTVKAGQLLFELSAERLDAAGSIDARADLQLNARREQIARRRDAALDQLAQQGRTLGQQQQAAEAALAGHRSAITIQDTLVKNARATYGRYAQLAQSGFIAPAQLTQYGNARDLELAKRAALSINLQSAVQALAQVRGDQLALHAQARVARADASANLAVLEQEAAEHDGRRAIGVTAPSAGRATTFAYSVGQTVAAGAVLATLLPTGAVLEAQLLIPSQAKASIRRGQRVQLRIDAFPYQKYGLVLGTITQVELMPINDGAPAAAPTTPMYRASVALSTDALLKYGVRTPFEPGMTLEADVFNDRRRLIEWVFDPLVSAAKDRAPSGRP